MSASLTQASITHGWRISPLATAIKMSPGREPYDPAPHLKLLSDAIVDTVTRGGRLIVQLPPRHGKSHLISTFTPLWFLENFPSRYIINCGYGADFASEWGAKVRDLVKEHEQLLSFRLKADSLAANKWRTDQGGGMTTAGIGGGITGRGAHLLLIDDPIKNWEEASSWTLRERHWNWWNSTARSRIEAVMDGRKRICGGAVIIVLTRWNEDDLAGRIIAQGAEEWRVITLPAIYDEKAAAAGPCPLGRKVGDPLWPERHPREALEPLMRGSAVVWESLYQQRPGTTGGLGNVYSEFKEHTHVRTCVRDPRLPLVWALDFNRDPFCTVIAQYKEYFGPKSYLTNERLALVEVLDELCLSEAGTLEMCEAAHARFQQICGNARTRLEIYGDPAGAAGHTSQTAGSDYDIIREFFRNKSQFQVIFNVRRKAPAIKDRVNLVNGMFRNALGESRATVDPRCAMLRRDFQNVRWKRDLNGNVTGGLDKSQADLTHISDAYGYFVECKFGRGSGGSGEQNAIAQ